MGVMTQARMVVSSTKPVLMMSYQYVSILFGTYQLVSVYHMLVQRSASMFRRGRKRGKRGRGSGETEEEDIVEGGKGRGKVAYIRSD